MNKFFRKICIKFLSILVVICFVSIINTTDIKGLNLDDIGASDVNSFNYCDGSWNGCIAQIGWRFTVIKSYSISTSTVSYTKVSQKTYDREDYLRNYYGLVAEIKKGETYFENILTGTGVSKTDFFSKGYSILIEPYFFIWYWPKSVSSKSCPGKAGCYKMSNAKTMSGLPSKISTFIYKNYSKYDGFRSVNQLFACTAYIPRSGGNDGYCTQDPSIYNGKKYLEMAKPSDSRYGKAIVYGKDITPPPSKGFLEIYKYNGSGNLIQDSVTFGLYNNSNCSGNPISTFSFNGKTKREFDIGTYYIKERIAPRGYILDETCRSFKIEGNKTTTMSVTNNKTCSSEYESLKSSGLHKNPIARINLYKKYPTFTGLLNFDLEVEPCRKWGTTNAMGLGCLSTNFYNHSKFDHDDLSGYDRGEEVTVRNGAGNELTGYCSVTFELKNKLTGGYTENYFFGTNLSGKLVYQKNDPEIATGTLTKRCYVYGADLSYDVKSAFSNSSYNRYVKSLEFNGDTLRPILGRETEWTKETGSYGGSNYVLFTKSINVKYNLNPVYALNGKGDISYVKCSNNACKFLGYGIVSNLNSPDGENIIPFSLKLTEGLNLYKNSLSSDGSTYSTKKEIIDNPEDNISKQENLNMEFRLIDTKNPFPGKSGNGRTVGSNWCFSGDCNNTNLLIKDVILDGNDSYNKTKEGSKYTIRLTPSIMKNIRDYNDNHSYDDYTLKCDENGENCTSTFLSSFNIRKRT